MFEGVVSKLTFVVGLVLLIVLVSAALESPSWDIAAMRSAAASLILVFTFADWYLSRPKWLRIALVAWQPFAVSCAGLLSGNVQVIVIGSAMFLVCAPLYLIAKRDRTDHRNTSHW